MGLEAPYKPQKFISHHEATWPIVVPVHMRNRFDDACRNKKGSGGVETAGFPAECYSDFCGIRLIVVEIREMIGERPPIRLWIPIHEVPIERDEQVGFRPNMSLASIIFLTLEETRADEIE